uniref:Tartrate-resistant acid phosphatase type 5 n=1 Tax=Panagrellus redivivus TaxID=6233 RepID=A0A7E4VGH8_PANRE
MAHVICVVGVVFLAGFTQAVTSDSVESRLACTTTPGCTVNATKLSFLVVGDTGGLPGPLYTSYAQRKVATAMKKVVESEDSKFVINLGDNFYFNGVDNLQDQRFWKSFESPYSDLIMPWFVIAGNHDHLGNVTAQILHTNRSNLWTFPSMYYSVRYSFNGANVQFVMIDTIQLCGNCIDVDGNSPLDWLLHNKLVPDHPDDPAAADKQWAWIEGELANSTADYLFVAGHYPIYSTCEHGPNSCLQDRLDPLLRRYGVTAYLAGHDHDLQLLQHTNETDGTSLLYVVSGAGSRSDRSTKNSNAVPEGSLFFKYPKGWNPFSQVGLSNGGFVEVTLGPQNGTFTYYNGILQDKYSHTFVKRTKIELEQ